MTSSPPPLSSPSVAAVPSETKQKKTHLLSLSLCSFFSPNPQQNDKGFSHAAFVFGYESLVHRGREPGGGVPPGALVSFVQKGLQYLELEANVAEDPGGGGGPAVRGDFAALSASDLITKDVEELKRAVAERRERGGGAGGGAGPGTTAAGAGAGSNDGPPISEAAVTRLEGHGSEVFTLACAGDGLRGRDREALERWERRGRRRWRWRRRRRWRRGGCLCVVHLAAHSRRGLGDNYNRSSSCPPGGQDPRRHHARLVPVRQPARHGLVRRRRAPVVGERRLARALARAALGAYLLPQVGEAAAW